MTSFKSNLGLKNKQAVAQYKKSSLKFAVMPKRLGPSAAGCKIINAFFTQLLFSNRATFRWETIVSG